jgi:hypothetical protein
MKVPKYVKTLENGTMTMTRNCSSCRLDYNPTDMTVVFKPTVQDSSELLVLKFYYHSHALHFFLLIARELQPNYFTSKEVLKKYFVSMPQSHWMCQTAEFVADIYNSQIFILKGKGHHPRRTVVDPNLSKILVSFCVPNQLVGTGNRSFSRFYPKVVIDAFDAHYDFLIKSFGIELVPPM